MKTILALTVACLAAAGCSMKQAGYAAAGAGIGAGVGYSYHHEAKDAVLGGLAGGAVGAVVGGIEERIGNNKHKAGYEAGYKKAQAELAAKDWEENTGKGAGNDVREPKRLIEIKVPKREQDNVVYDDHYVVVEDYR